MNLSNKGPLSLKARIKALILEGHMMTDDLTAVQLIELLDISNDIDLVGREMATATFNNPEYGKCIKEAFELFLESNASIKSSELKEAKVAESPLTLGNYKTNELSIKQREYMDLVNKDIDLVGLEMVRKTYLNSAYNQVIHNLFKEILIAEEYGRKIKTLVEKLSDAIKNANMIALIESFVICNKTDLPILRSYCHSNTTMCNLSSSLLCLSLQEGNLLYYEMEKLVAWLNTDLAKVLKETQEALADSVGRRNVEILKLYYEKHTLSNIGQKYDLSRERVRQIVEKAKRKYSFLFKALNFDILVFFNCLTGHRNYYSLSDIENACGNWASFYWDCILYYLLIMKRVTNFYYSQDMAAVVFCHSTPPFTSLEGEMRAKSEIEGDIQELSNALFLSNKSEIINLIAKKCSYPVQVIEHYFNELYLQLGLTGVYAKRSFFQSEQNLYLFVAHFFFPSGITITSRIDMLNFERLLDLFHFPKTTHSAVKSKIKLYCKYIGNDTYDTSHIEFKDLFAIKQDNEEEKSKADPANILPAPSLITAKTSPRTELHNHKMFYQRSENQAISTQTINILLAYIHDSPHYIIPYSTILDDLRPVLSKEGVTTVQRLRYFLKQSDCPYEINENDIRKIIKNPRFTKR